MVACRTVTVSAMASLPALAPVFRENGTGRKTLAARCRCRARLWTNREVHS